MTEFEDNLGAVDLRGMRPVRQDAGTSTVGTAISFGIQAINAFAKNEANSEALAIEQAKQERAANEAKIQNDVALFTNELAQGVSSGALTSSGATVLANNYAKQQHVQYPEYATTIADGMSKFLGKPPSEIIFDNAASKEAAMQAESKEIENKLIENGYSPRSFKDGELIDKDRAQEFLATEERTKKAIESNSVEVPNLAFEVASNNMSDITGWINSNAPGDQIVSAFGGDQNKLTLLNTLQKVSKGNIITTTERGNAQVALENIKLADIDDYKRGLIQTYGSNTLNKDTINTAIENFSSGYDQYGRMLDLSTKGAGGREILNTLTNTVKADDANFAIKHKDFLNAQTLTSKLPDVVAEKIWNSPVSEGGKTLSSMITTGVINELTSTTELLGGEKKKGNLGDKERADALTFGYDKADSVANGILNSGEVDPQQLTNWGNWVDAIVDQASKDPDDMIKTMDASILKANTISAIDKLQDTDPEAAGSLVDSVFKGQQLLYTTAAQELTQFPKGLVEYDAENDAVFVNTRKLQQAFLADNNLLKRTRLDRKTLEDAEARGVVAPGVGSDSFNVQISTNRGGYINSTQNSNPIYQQLSDTIVKFDKAAALSRVTDLPTSEVLAAGQAGGYINVGTGSINFADPKARKAAQLRKNLDQSYNNNAPKEFITVPELNYIDAPMFGNPEVPQ
jgi:hypothetical protein